jgi:hypothetical protein
MEKEKGKEIKRKGNRNRKKNKERKNTKERKKSKVERKKKEINKRWRKKGKGDERDEENRVGELSVCIEYSDDLISLV